MEQTAKQEVVYQRNADFPPLESGKYYALSKKEPLRVHMLEDDMVDDW